MRRVYCNMLLCMIFHVHMFFCVFAHLNIVSCKYSYFCVFAVQWPGLSDDTLPPPIWDGPTIWTGVHPHLWYICNDELVFFLLTIWGPNFVTQNSWRNTTLCYDRWPLVTIGEDPVRGREYWASSTLEYWATNCSSLLLPLKDGPSVCRRISGQQRDGGQNASYCDTMRWSYWQDFPTTQIR